MAAIRLSSLGPRNAACRIAAMTAASSSNRIGDVTEMKKPAMVVRTPPTNATTHAPANSATVTISATVTQSGTRVEPEESAMKRW
jgi:hypothetical protein